ncbi:hypothetical protein [uncultured Neglectibacter sp.]|uniref:hypothetical protein n=1 Tax=uncultured Neglectibacter sp. TaxID=1924108 RepID=UPI0034DF1F54
MKKVFAIVLCICMLAVMAACSGGANGSEYKLGMGVALNMDSSAENNAQVDATVAAVVTDKDGKIVSCRIDVAQSKMDVTGGAVDTAATFETKMELGSRYGMEGKVDNNGDGVMLEWDAQAKAFEEYVVGKTADEVKAFETQEVNGEQIAVAEDLLKAGCSMQITDFMKAVAAACNDEQGMSFKAGEFTLGVAANTSAADSTAATADEDGLVAMYTDFSAAVVSDGKIVAALNDAVQPKITIDANGAIVSTEYKDTKRNLKSEYGMEGKVDNDGDGVMKEWFEQSEAFSKFIVGKTADEVSALETQDANGHQIAADKDLLSAGCSMQITSMKDTSAKAAKNAR